MAYVNERVRPENARTFIVKGYILEEQTPLGWTIDREKDYILFGLSGWGRPEPDEYEPGAKDFGFYYKGQVYLCEMIKNYFGNGNVFEWRFRYTDDPVKKYGWDAEIVEELRKAFNTYADRGMHPEYVEVWEKKHNEKNPNLNGIVKAGF